MPTSISFKDAVKAAKFLAFYSMPLTYREGGITQFQFIFSVSDASDVFLKPEFDARFEIPTNDLSFYEDKDLVYHGLATDFSDSEYAQKYFARISDYWNVVGLIQEMRNELINLVGHPLDRYRGDFKDTRVYELWHKQTQPSREGYSVPDMLKILPMDEEEKRKILRQYNFSQGFLGKINPSSATTQRKIADQLLEAMKQLVQELAQVKRKEMDVEIMAGIRKLDLSDALWEQAQSGVFKDFDDVLDGKKMISQIMQPYILRREKTRVKEIEDDMMDSFELRRKYGKEWSAKSESQTTAEHQSQIAGHVRAFVSYSSQDEDVAIRIVESLKSAGLECWLDKKDILIGEFILDRVREGITKESDYTVILLSKNSVASEWCKLELRMAYQKEIALKRVVVLPIRIDQTDVPEEVKTKKYYQLEASSEVSFNSLIEEIKSLVRRQTN